MEKRPDSLRAKVSKYFVAVNPDDKKNIYFICQIENCGKACNGSQITNLTTHAKTAHTTFYAKNIYCSPLDPKKLAIKRLKCIQDCAEVIAINGRSFKSLSDSGIKKLIAEKLTELKDAGYGLGLRAPHYSAVRKHISHQAQRIDEEIRKEIKGKFVALMVDTASRNNRTFLGLSLQYVLDGRAVIRCIDMSEMNISHSSINLKNLIMHRLEHYAINIAQVISITTDNASNMIAMLKRFNVLGDEEESDDESDDESDNEENDGGDDKNENGDSSSGDESDNGNFEFDLSDLERQGELDELLDDNSEYVALIESCVNELAKQTLIINAIRCAAHTLQLAVGDAVTQSHHFSFINQIREMCKFLRKATSVRELKDQKIYISLPRMDCKTRWSSLYRLVCIVHIYKMNIFTHKLQIH